MTANLKEIFTHRLSKNGFQQYFYEELVELINDEDILVRMEALEVAIEIMQTKITEK